MAQKFYCDKCGEYIPEDKKHKLDIYRDNENECLEVDLCEKHFVEFKKMFNVWLRKDR